MSGAAKISAWVFCPRRKPAGGRRRNQLCRGYGSPPVPGEVFSSLAPLRTPKSASGPRNNSFRPDSPLTTTSNRGQKTQPAPSPHRTWSVPDASSSPQLNPYFINIRSWLSGSGDLTSIRPPHVQRRGTAYVYGLPEKGVMIIVSKSTEIKGLQNIDIKKIIPYRKLESAVSVNRAARILADHLSGGFRMHLPNVLLIIAEGKKIYKLLF